MKIITPDCEYQQDIERYKQNLKHLKPGSRVLIKRSDPAGIAEALIGNWELNLVSIPVEPYHTPADVMQFVTNDCRPHAIVNCTDSDVIFEFCNGGELSPETDHAIFYTSGTTGNPKGVVQTRAGMRHNALATAELHGFNTDSVHLTALPLYHCNAAAMSLFGNYFVGGTVVFLKKFSPDAYFGNAEQYGAETANLVPTQVADLVNARLTWPKSLRYVLTAATALGQEICREFYNLYGPKLRQGYGLSEAVNFSFTMPLLDDSEFKKQMVDNYPAVGLPIPGTEFRIVNEEVQVRGPNLMRGYWNNPEATETAFDNGWLKTGDRGELRDGYMVLTGRFKEIIIKGGENYSPVMIEDQYRRHGLTGEFAVVGCQDLRLGEAFALIIDPANTTTLNSTLPANLRPSVINYSTVLRTSTRKPQRGKMSKDLFTVSLPESGYSASMEHAGRVAKKVLSLGPAKNAQQEYILNVATKLAPYAGPGQAYPTLAPYFNEMEQCFPAYWLGEITAHDIIRNVGSENWVNLMCEYPMGEYPKMVLKFLESKGLLAKRILEVGAGIGNFTRLVKNRVTGSYLRTDIRKKFLTGEFGFPECQIDISQPIAGEYDCIVGVNVFHCADPAALTNSYSALASKGFLVMGEGNPCPTDTQDVWAMDLKCGLIDGWWDAGGFRDRETWTKQLRDAGFRNLGFSVLREGKYDLGGLIWAQKD